VTNGLTRWRPEYAAAFVTAVNGSPLEHSRDFAPLISLTAPGVLGAAGRINATTWISDFDVSEIEIQQDIFSARTGVDGDATRGCKSDK
jgi:hypothetical protein